MHEKRSKIDFFVNFRQLQKKLPICKKKYAEILHVSRAVVTNVEKKVKRRNRIFFGSHLEEQSVVKKNGPAYTKNKDIAVEHQPIKTRTYKFPEWSLFHKKFQIFSTIF